MTKFLRVMFREIRENERRETYRPHILHAESNPIIHGYIFGQNPTRSSVSYGIRIDFPKDAIGHSMTDEPADIALVQPNFLSNLSIRSSFIDRERFSLSTR